MSGESDDCVKCHAHFIRSVVTHTSETQIHLHCGICDEDYTLPKSTTQEKKLKNKYGDPSQIEPIRDTEDITSGDIIAIKRYKGLYEHHAIVKQVDRGNRMVKVIEFAADLPAAKGKIRETDMKFDEDILNKDAFVRRYMPLDCLPVNEVLNLAEGFVNDPESQIEYDAFVHNCQHLASWCKTKQMKSKEGPFFEKLYGFVVNATYIVLSVFENPYVRIASQVIAKLELDRCRRAANIKDKLRDKGMLSDDLEKDLSIELFGTLGTVVRSLAIFIIEMFFK